MTVPFTITHPPQFTVTGGQITSVQLTGLKIFTKMTTIKIDDNGSNPTTGLLAKGAQNGLIDATHTEFVQVCNGVNGMQQGDQRTLEITCDTSQNPVPVTGVSVNPPLGLIKPHLTGASASNEQGHARPQHEAPAQIVSELRMLNALIREGLDRFGRPSDIRELAPTGTEES